MMEWQSIETAPKDGTRILVHEYGDVVIAYWRGRTQRWYGPRDTYGDEDVMYPSHWMPLPEPPK